MSNIAKQPVKIIEGVTVNIANDKITVSGPKGELTAKVPEGVNIIISDGQIKVAKSESSVELDKYAGLMRAIAANLVKGVSTGFERKLELTGVGYRAKVDGTDLVLNVGYSIPVKITPIPGTKISVEENIITVSGADKQLVGDVADNIRRVRPPDPYKGKGIKYVGEHLRRKVGKAAKAVGGK